MWTLNSEHKEKMSGLTEHASANGSQTSRSSELNSVPPAGILFDIGMSTSFPFDALGFADFREAIGTERVVNVW